MSTRPVIFISAVSKELHSARDLVAKTLHALGYEPKWQDIAPTGAGDLRAVLRTWVDGSDAVLQLVGHCYGFAPATPDATFGECSYTQLEALYARQQGKKVWYLILTPEHPTDPCAAEAPALRALQDAYRTQVTGTDYLYHRSNSLDKTALLVHGIKNELAELRQQDQAWQEQVQQSLDATDQKLTDLTAEVLARFDDLKQQAYRQPHLLLKPESWPQAAPFHNRAFPDQHNFVGRAALLSAMKQSLDAERNVALTQPVAMHGAGGIGKTRAAVEFARAHGSDYTLRLFLDAQSPESLRASLAEVARRLGLSTEPQAKEDALVLLALRLLRAAPTALVVADNADTPAALEAVRLLCHEPGGVRWLITTRLTDLGEEFAAQPVELLSEAEAVKLLQQRGRKNRHHPGSDTEALAVAIELGRLPLALQQAGAYVAHQRLTWAAYRRLLNANPAQALSEDAKEMKDVPESILRTYSISLQQLSPLALTLLEVAAHLAPAPIPEAVFLHKDDDNARRAALVELADLSLLEWQAGKLELHRAIAIAVRLNLSQGESHRVRLEEACHFVAASCAPKDPHHPDHWPTWASLRPHIECLLNEVGSAGVAAKAYDWLLAHWPIYLSALGEYAAATGFYLTSIAWRQQTIGEEHPNTLASRSNLAAALRGHGKHVEAELEHRAVLKIGERVQGTDQTLVLASRNNLANTLYSQGRFAEAEKEHRMVLNLRERLLGAEHSDTLASRGNLAAVFLEQGKHAEAEQEQRAVLQIQERVLGAEHPDALRGRNNLASALNAQGKHNEAEQEQRAVLQIQVRVLGAEHPETLASQNNLALALQAQGKHVEAELEHRVALQIKERVLGPEHPDTLKSRNNLANVMQAQGKYAEVEREQMTVSQISARVLGPDHPTTLGSRSNLANALQAQGKHAEAEVEHRAVLRTLERVLSADHSNVAFTCYNLALCLAAQQKLSEALGIMYRAEKVWMRMLGPVHKHTNAAKAARERLEAALKQAQPSP